MEIRPAADRIHIPERAGVKNGKTENQERSQKPDAGTWIGNPPSAKSGRRKSERSPKTGHRNREGTRKPSAENREKPESRTKEPGGNPKKGTCDEKRDEKRGCPTKSPPQAKITPVGDCSDRGEHVRPNSSDCLLYRQFRPPAGLLYRLRDKSRASTPSNVSRTGSIRPSASNVIRSMHTCR